MTATTCTSTTASTTTKRRPGYQIHMERLVQECADSNNAHPWLQEFATSPLATLFQTNVPLAQSFGRVNRSRIRKELIESAALSFRLKRVLKSLDPNTTTCTNTTTRSLVIWDLCCGKGFSSLWLTCNTFADCTASGSSPKRKIQVHMTDINGDSDRSWLNDNPDLFGKEEAAHGRRLTFHCLDIYSKVLEDKIKASVVSDSAEPSFLILVGIHTCGDLSRRVLELGQICQAHATVLSPCCCVRDVGIAKRRTGSFGYETPAKARNFNGIISVYQLWCWMLWGYAQSQQEQQSSQQQQPHENGGEPRRNKIDLTCETLMKTDKNVWLTVISSSSRH